MEWPHVFETTVHFGDLDGAQHVHNVTYFRWFETARSDLYLRLTGARNVKEFDIIIASTSADFASPAFLGERIRIVTRPTRIGESSFTLEYEVEGEDGRIVARGRSVQVAYDRDASRKKPIGPRVRELLQKAARRAVSLAPSGSPARPPSRGSRRIA